MKNLSQNTRISSTPGRTELSCHYKDSKFLKRENIHIIRSKNVKLWLFLERTIDIYSKK